MGLGNWLAIGVLALSLAWTIGSALAERRRGPRSPEPRETGVFDTWRRWPTWEEIQDELRWMAFTIVVGFPVILAIYIIDRETNQLLLLIVAFSVGQAASSLVARIHPSPQ